MEQKPIVGNAVLPTKPFRIEDLHNITEKELTAILEATQAEITHRHFQVSDCPFCGADKFKSSDEKQAWKCFACNESGNVLDFAAKKNGTSVKVAAEWLEQTFMTEQKPKPFPEISGFKLVLVPMYLPL